MHRSHSPSVNGFFGVTGLFAVAVTLTALFGAACGGGSEAKADPPRLLEATAERVVVDGLATLSSRVTLRFNRPVELSGDLPEGEPEATIRLPESEQDRFEVPAITVTGAASDQGSSRLITIMTDGLVPAGAVISFDPRALVDGGVVAHKVSIFSALTPIDVILASGAMVFAGVERGAPVPITPTEADRDNDLIRIRLQQHLAFRLALGGQSTQDVLDLYDVLPRGIIPHPKVRAAMAALLGTFAQPALTSLLTEDNCTGEPAALIDFQIPPSSSALLAEITFADSGRRILSLHPVSEGDRFEHLMPLLAHEAVHCESGNSVVEEIASTAFDTYLYTILVALDPSLVEANTPLARNLRIDVVVMANSGRLVPDSVGVLQSVGVQQAVPEGIAPASSFAEYVGRAYDALRFESQGTERTARQYVNELIGLTDLTAGSAFDLEFLDALLGKALPRAIMFEAIVALELIPE